ncbi:hypothetical protein [Streptomyces sp. AC512_CC834]|uniref:hypothetical protein n=1 Tax=Streptomyces sp. AC512_CC834 TaxID=2823691 RepID=UPI001C25A0BD|nr:hypothetical protein [Streptomyces sp. AC512_CC834]
MSGRTHAHVRPRTYARARTPADSCPRPDKTASATFATPVKIATGSGSHDGFGRIRR